jgi:hypothetical protein
MSIEPVSVNEPVSVDSVTTADPVDRSKEVGSVGRYPPNWTVSVCVKSRSSTPKMP